MTRPLTGALLTFLGLIAVTQTALAQHDEDPRAEYRDSARHNATDHTHDRHRHAHNPPHPAAHDPARFHTSRQSSIDLPLPGEEDAFFFIVYGDRTGGIQDGVAVLKDAVRDTNLLEPDFVMTVGDMIQGYNTTPDWMSEMREFKSAMDELLCPWFPVAGNHDVYWRGPNAPEGEHEKSYEMHFGPLWYAFEHKGSMFIALYSDEGNPETGEKTFRDPENQRMSPEQFEWLSTVLDRAEDMENTFVFLHHPRWLGGGYGDDWDKVHDRLVEAGNVRAVFAGHIHRMTYRGPKDGIEYFTLATVGGVQRFDVPRAGHLHHFNVVTVRENQIAVAAIPVGEVLDPRDLTEELQEAAYTLARAPIDTDREIVFNADGSVDPTIITASIDNPTPYDADITVAAHSPDPLWTITPDHSHGILASEGSGSYTFRIARAAGPTDASLAPVTIAASTSIRSNAFRYDLPATERTLPADVSAVLSEPSRGMNHVLRTGPGAVAKLEPEAFTLPQGAFTIECWFRADELSRRTGLLANTQSKGFGIFVSEGRPEFSAHLDGTYRRAGAEEPIIEVGRWHHIAGVYDCETEVRLYLDGTLIATGEVPEEAFRTVSDLPFIIGGDVDSSGNPTSEFTGLIDDVRLSNTARYDGERFRVRRRTPPELNTLFLLDMESAAGPWIVDRGTGLAATALGAERLEMAPQRTRDRIRPSR